MVDKNTPGDKKLSVPSKTLTLKLRIETGTVRQSFPHGRTKQVVVGTGCWCCRKVCLRNAAGRSTGAEPVRWDRCTW